MAEARDSRMWNHTAEIVAAAYNSNPFRSGKPISPTRIHPYKQTPVAPLPKIKAEDIFNFFQT